MKLHWIIAAAILIAASNVVYAAQPKPEAGAADKALLVRNAPGPNGPQVQIDVVDRPTSTRIYSLTWWACGCGLTMQNLADGFGPDWRPAGALAVKGQVGAKIMETGVEPDVIPVRGDEGKKLCTEGMVLLEEGEFTRKGEYWDSSAAA